MKHSLLKLISAFLFVLPSAALAAGGHDFVSCEGCHSLHEAKSGNFILKIEPNTKDLNPRTNQPYGGVSAVCLGCHQTAEKGGRGMTPINGHMSHPFSLSSVNPKIARVPEEFLKNGRFECTSCHEPHPSNANPKYLRMSGDSMESFCGACHPNKVDQKAVKSESQPEGKQAAAPATEKKKR